MARDYETVKNLLLGYYLIINIILFVLMYVDKKRAIAKKWRIKENTLFLCSLLGGFVGGFGGMHYFRHKTKKPKFYLVYTSSAIIHLYFIYLVFIK